MASGSFLRAQVRIRSNTPVMCPHHRGKKTEFVCLTPRCTTTFACVECVPANHRGHNLVKLETHAEEKKKILKNKIKDMKENVIDSLTQKIETTKSKIASHKSQTKDEQQTIFQRCNEMKEELDEMARKCADSCERTGEKNDRKLTEHMWWLESIYAKYKSALEKCEEVIEEGSDFEIVLVERDLPSTPEIQMFPDVDVSKFKFGRFTNQKFEELFGEVITMSDNTMISYALAKTHISQPGAHDASALPAVGIDVLSQFDLQGNSGSVCGLLYPLQRKQLYIWFIKSNAVLVVTHDGKLTDTITLQHSLERRDYIQDVCVSAVDETLWSLSTNGKIQQVKQDGVQLQPITYVVGRQEKPKSLYVTRSQEVVVGVINPILVLFLTTTGQVIRIFEKKDMVLISYPQNIIQCQKTGLLAVRDLDCVCVVDENYCHLYTIHGEMVTSGYGGSRATGYACENKFDPRRMCFNEDGNLLVVDYGNYSIVMFKPNGQYIQTITKEKNINKCPATLTTAPNRTLWVAYRDGIVRQIKYK